MIENIKKLLNEEQDPKAIEKITSKLADLLMKNEEVGYIGVQKKPVTVLPDSIVLTNKRIIICRPKNLGLSMEFLDYDWDDVAGIFVKENILGSEFSFSTKSDLTISIDYIPKTQARKIATFAKEQLDLLKNGIQKTTNDQQITILEAANIDQNLTEPEIIETETIELFAEIMPVNYNQADQFQSNLTQNNDNILKILSQEELFDKLQNYKKLLDNGLILQGEYDAFKKEILGLM